MPNGETRNWKRLCFALEGFRFRFGHWPTRLRLFHAALTDLRDNLLTLADFAALERQVTLIADDEAGFIAEDDEGNVYNYGQEGRIGGWKPTAGEWLGIGPRREPDSRPVPPEEACEAHLSDEHKALLTRLESPEAVDRRDAAAALYRLAAADERAETVYAPIPRLKEAMWDEDREAADLAALALLARSWKFKSTAGFVPVIDKYLRGQDRTIAAEARNLMRYAATLHASPRSAAPALTRLLIHELGTGTGTETGTDTGTDTGAGTATDPAGRRRALDLLAAHGVYTSDIETLAPLLLSVLEDDEEEDENLTLALMLLGQYAGPEFPGDAAGRIDPLRRHGAAMVRYSAGDALAAVAAAARPPDLPALRALMGDADHCVREGAAARLGQCLFLDREDVGDFAVVLSLGLRDAAGGVNFESAKALRAAAEDGIDIGPAREALFAVRGEGPYSREGWASGPLDMKARSALRGHWLGTDATVALMHHYLDAGDEKTIRELLTDVPEGYDPDRWMPRLEAIEVLRELAASGENAVLAERAKALLAGLDARDGKDGG